MTIWQRINLAISNTAMFLFGNDLIGANFLNSPISPNKSSPIINRFTVCCKNKSKYDQHLYTYGKLWKYIYLRGYVSVAINTLLTVSVSFLLLESACLSRADSCRIVTLPFSWLTARCWRLPYGDERQHIAILLSTWELISWRIVWPWSPL